MIPAGFITSAKDLYQKHVQGKVVKTEGSNSFLLMLACDCMEPLSDVDKGGKLI